MARIFSSGRTPTGRSVNDYLGRPPRNVGTGPKNMAKSAAAATSQVRAGRPKGSVARSPRISPSRASAGFGPPPAASGSGMPRASSALVRAPSRTINKPKTGRPRRGLGKPRADFPSKI